MAQQQRFLLCLWGTAAQSLRPGLLHLHPGQRPGPRPGQRPGPRPGQRLVPGLAAAGPDLAAGDFTDPPQMDRAAMDPSATDPPRMDRAITDPSATDQPRMVPGAILFALVEPADL